MDTKDINLWAGWEKEPFNRLKGTAISKEYPIIIAWGKDTVQVRTSNNLVCIKNEYNGGQIGVWKIKDGYLNDWETLTGISLCRTLTKSMLQRRTGNFRLVLKANNIDRSLCSATDQIVGPEF